MSYECPRCGCRYTAATVTDGDFTFNVCDECGEYTKKEEKE